MHTTNESAEFLPSYEVIAGLALALGASELYHAHRTGKLDDSILIAIGKEISGKLGAAIKATGAAAKKVVDQFKKDRTVRDAIADAEERVNESMYSHNRVMLFEEYFSAAGQLAESRRKQFFIEVSVRDARKAQDIYQDQFRRRKSIDPTSTSSYEITDEEDAADFLMALTDQGIEISDTNISA